MRRVKTGSRYLQEQASNTLFLRFLCLFAAIASSVPFAAVPFLASLDSSMDQKAMTTELDTLLAAAVDYQAPAGG